MDFEKYKIKLNIASAKLFERMTDKSFYEMEDLDILILAYCCLVANNEFFIPYESFLEIMKNRKIAVWIENEMEKIGNYLKDILKLNEETDGSEQKNNEKTEKPKLSDLSSDLIISYGMDPHYVNYEMPIYELDIYYKAAERKYHADIEERRLFSYLDNMSNFKKKMKLEEYLPLPWETERKKKKAEHDIRFNREAIINTFKKMNENGERGNDDIAGSKEFQQDGGGTETIGEGGTDYGSEACPEKGNDGDSKSGKGEPCSEP